MKRERERVLPARGLLDSGRFCGRIDGREAQPTADHTLIRIGRNEAACSCGVWHVRTEEVLQTEITRTLNELHEGHVRQKEPNERGETN